MQIDGEVKIHARYDELVDPKKLKNYSRNRNKHPQSQIERLASAYKYHGIRHPIVVDKERQVIAAGHGRKLAAIRAGIKEFPVVYQTFESEEALYTFCQADNASTMESELDLAGINLDLAEIGPFDIDSLLIPDFAVEPADKYKTDPDEVPEVNKKNVKTKLGDLYELGNHRLLCGDSTDKDTVERLMGGEMADMVFTDPPYNVNYESNHTGKIKNDNMSDESFSVFLRKAFKNLHYFSKDAFVYIWHATLIKEFDDEIRGLDWKINNKICWVKDIPTYSMAKYKWQYEPCFFIEHGKPKWGGDKTRTNVWNIKSIQSAGSISDDGKKWFQGGSSNLSLHPTQKPVELCKTAIKDCDPSKVLDLFGGSGSTLIACEKTNRKCFMMELDPYYVQTIIERWCKFTGKEAYRLDGGGKKTSWTDINKD